MFEQKRWLKPYTDLSTELRSDARKTIHEFFCKCLKKSPWKLLQPVRKGKRIYSQELLTAEDYNFKHSLGYFYWSIP